MSDLSPLKDPLFKCSRKKRRCRHPPRTSVYPDGRAYRVSGVAALGGLGAGGLQVACNGKRDALDGWLRPGQLVRPAAARPAAAQLPSAYRLKPAGYTQLLQPGLPRPLRSDAITLTGYPSGNLYAEPARYCQLPPARKSLFSKCRLF